MDYPKQQCNRSQFLEPVMNRRDHVAIVIATAFSSLLLASCSPTIQTLKVEALSPKAATNPDSLVVLMQNAFAPGRYEPFGQLFVETKWADTEGMIMMMRKPAAEMGAQAVIGMHSQNFLVSGSYYQWTAGVAAKSFEGTTTAAKPGFLIELAPVVFPDSADVRQEDRRREDSLICLGAQYYLESNGYYAWRMSTDSSGYFKDFTNLVCQIRYEGSGGVGAAVFASRTYNLNARIVDKASSLVVWQASGTGASIGFGLANLVTALQGGHREVALFKAVNALFSYLPVYDQLSTLGLNPCLDSMYVGIQGKPWNSLSAKERKYWQKKGDECQAYESSIEEGKKRLLTNH